MVHPQDYQHQQRDVHCQVEALHLDHELCLLNQGPGTYHLPTAPDEAHHTHPLHHPGSSSVRRHPVARDQGHVRQEPRPEVVFHGQRQFQLQPRVFVPVAGAEVEHQVERPENPRDPDGHREDAFFADVPRQPDGHAEGVEEEHDDAGGIEGRPGLGVRVPRVPVPGGPRGLYGEHVTSRHGLPAAPPREGGRRGGAVAARAQQGAPPPLLADVLLADVEGRGGQPPAVQPLAAQPRGLLQPCGPKRRQRGAPREHPALERGPTSFPRVLARAEGRRRVRGFLAVAPRAAPRAAAQAPLAASSFPRLFACAEGGRRGHGLVAVAPSLVPGAALAPVASCSAAYSSEADVPASAAHGARRGSLADCGDLGEACVDRLGEGV
mmetsp:Transcript_19619/g.53915  ORF Transcript_19619/g.53915 Transcript_19619/m.53915 type:complete len:380 (-) Transcript_19619:73-1212(-)